MHEAVAREAGGDVEARRARAHGASGGGTRRSPAGGPNSRGGSAGPCSTAPVAVRFGIAKRCAAPPLRVYGRKWNPDSSSMTSGIFASFGNGPIASMIVRRPDRYGHARARRERGGPRAGREEDAIGADLSVARARTRDATVLGKQGVDANALDQPYALGRGGRHEPPERLHRRAVAVARAKPAALQIVGADAGYEPGDPFAPDHLDLDAELPVERQRIAERRQALVGLGEEEVAVLFELVRAARERAALAPELGRELREAHVELVNDLMADAAEPALRGAGAEGPLLEGDHIGLAALGDEER